MLRILPTTAAGFLMAAASALAGRTDIPGPPGTVEFGTEVKMLPNGNFVVVDQAYKSPETGIATGAVFVYRKDGSLVSLLTGGRNQDRAGSGGITVLANGNFVVSSPLWDNGGVADAGAVTWGSMTEGVSGVISPANSLVGSRAKDMAGGADPSNTSWTGGIFPLTNGNYVVCSPDWDNGSSMSNAGAVTWGNGATGISGAISGANSLAGSAANQTIGRVDSNFGVTRVGSGHYVVYSRQGVTWCDGSTGRTGSVTPDNSLTGAGLRARIVALSTGDYVVANPSWNAGAGAVTWCSGNAVRTGQATEENSLVGSSADDRIGAFVSVNQSISPFMPVEGVVPLKNGNYVVVSPDWRKESGQSVGAVTLCVADGRTTGPVTGANSVLGTTAGDMMARILPLTSGDFVIAADQWDNGSVSDAGAVRLMSGVSPSTGGLTPENSLVGSRARDRVSIGSLTALTNGNFVISSPLWRQDQDHFPSSAVTWVNGATGLTGAVTTENSFTCTTSWRGSEASLAGLGLVTALTNGNYVIFNPLTKAVTWADGTKGITGGITEENSLRETGPGRVTPLPNGHYVISSPDWNNYPLAPWSGAVTWCSGTGPTNGFIGPDKSLIVNNSREFYKLGAIAPLIQANGNFVQLNTVHPGYVTPLSGTHSTPMQLSAGTSLTGGAISRNSGLTGSPPTFTSRSADASGQTLVVGNGRNLVTVYSNLIPDAPRLLVEQADSGDLLTGSTLDIGQVGQGSTLSVRLTLRNPSAFPLTLSVGNPSDPAFTVPFPEEPVTLPAGGSLVMPVVFTATGTGQRDGSITVSSDDPDSPCRITLRAEVVGSPPSVTTDLPAPDGSGAFGTQVTYLPNGNLVITDPEYDAPGPVADAGAVHLYAPSGTLISTATGAGAGSKAGDGGIIVLANGNFLIRSTMDSGGRSAPALTWVDGATGLNGTLSPANSMVAPPDSLALTVHELANGNYVVRSGAFWNNLMVRWGSGTSAATGVMSAENSLVGFLSGITLLTNGNFVLKSQSAVTLVSGTGPTTGAVSEQNSLMLPSWPAGVTALTDGNYVVALPELKVEGAALPGAVLWCDGVAGRKGAFPFQETLVSSGLMPGTGLGSMVITPLPGGKYAVRSPARGMVTWCLAGGATKGEISAENSLLGELLDLITLPNGNLVVRTAPAGGQSGAVAWMSAEAPITGALSAANALLGPAGSAPGSGGITVLDDGNYVVESPLWSGSGIDPGREGAITWCSGRTGRTGVISTENSLTGGRDRDRAGDLGVTPLKGGHYLTCSAVWRGIGAATWMGGSTDGAGVIDFSNSITDLQTIGLPNNDSAPLTAAVRARFAVALAGGNYVIRTGSGNALTWGDGGRPSAFRAPLSNPLISPGISPYPGITPLGNGNCLITSKAKSPVTPDGREIWALTLMDGRQGMSGTVSEANSLIQSPSYISDEFSWTVSTWADGAFAALCPGASQNFNYVAGMVFLGDGTAATAPKGAFSRFNSVRGEMSYNGLSMNTAYNPARRRWAVGRPKDNLVTLFSYIRPAEGRLSLEEPTGIVLENGGTVDFGLTDPGQPVHRTVSLVNTGSGALNWGALTLSDSQFRMETPAPAAALPPDGRTEARLSFTPASPGLKTGTLRLAPADPGGTVITVNLRGAAKPAADRPFGDGIGAAEITMLPEGKRSVRFQAVPRITYQLQRGTDLKTWDFTCLVTADDTGTVVFTDDQTAPACFYRLKAR